MRFIYGKQTLSDIKKGQELCYLLTNGLGGYSSLTAIGSCNRNDQAFFMAAVSAPCERFNVISRLAERIITEENEYGLSSQEYIDHTKNEKGYRFLEFFEKEEFPVWLYQTAGVEVRKEIVMTHEENEIAVRYEIINDTEQTVTFSCKPWMRFAGKGEQPLYGQLFETGQNTVKSAGKTLYFHTNGRVHLYENIERNDDCYYEYDARDGRQAVGWETATHSIDIQVKGNSEETLCIEYSFESERSVGCLMKYVEHMFVKEKQRLREYREHSGFVSEIAGQLVDSADAYLVSRTSTGEKSIIAGYPFFGDWGRDTMIAVNGLCLAVGRLEDAKSIFRSFIQYCRKGIMPNMFPETEKEPFYNTADASLLFILAVYEYYQKTRDIDFLCEAWPTMREILFWYMKGTDYHIYMDSDGLLCAGAGMEQVTWMDVRCNGILPTPRHGKAVEINAWWYNALCMMQFFSDILGEDGAIYENTAKQVKDHFEPAFWNEKDNCLRDTASGNRGDDQIRCNQIWVVSAPFSVLSPEKERAVVEKVFQELYTGCGLRSLNPGDREFHPVYGGCMYDRDMAYHQGTIWMFPLGAYYLAYLKINGNSAEAQRRVRTQLLCLEDCLREGCVGQLPEIYDGGYPSSSRGCFAQAWSVGELLRVWDKLEYDRNAALFIER